MTLSSRRAMINFLTAEIASGRLRNGTTIETDFGSFVVRGGELIAT